MMKPERLMILYEDDSVEVHYVDGSKLLLSPCGSEFLFEKALPASAHPLQPAERIRQRTQFVVSTYQEQLLQALDFRNQYSTSLFLPSSIIPPERKNILLTDISEVSWPRPNATGAAIRMHNGSVKISSLDGHAYLYMSELQQEFTVEFLCKVSQKSAASSLFSEKNNKQNKGQRGKSSKSFTSELLPKLMRMENKKDEHCWTTNKFRDLYKSNDYLHQAERPNEATSNLRCCSSEYVWVTQHWSVSSYPEEWKYPLSLALTFYQLHSDDLRKKNAENECAGNRIEEFDVLEESEQSTAVSHLHQALPLNCSAPHLHRWNFCDFFLQRMQDGEHNTYPLLIKIVWCQGIIYRLIHGNANLMEIYPGDGSVFTSEGAFLGNYFTRYSVHKETKQREEKTYSANNLPPDVPESPYSICSIITQATRILQYCYKAKLSLTHNYRICCWRMTPETDGREMLPFPLHETVIPNVGRLVAYSDNKVQALFCDGMTLNMVWDFNSCCGKTQINQGVTSGWCKLISPDGAQQLIKINHPGLYERYIRTVVTWCRSMKGDEGETILPTEKNWSAVAELEKIQRFNCLSLQWFLFKKNKTKQSFSPGTYPQCAPPCHATGKCQKKAEVLLENSSVPNKNVVAKGNPSQTTARPAENSLPEDIGKTSITETLEKTSKAIQDIESFLIVTRK